MTQQSSGSIVFKLIWQIALLVGLVAAAWVISQILPITKVTDNTENSPNSAAVTVYSLPRLSPDVPSALEEALAKISSAKEEVLVVARRLSSTAMLNSLKQAADNSVEVYTLLSPDTTANFARSPLANWLKGNNLTNIYKDLLTSTSHIIVVDSSTIFVSDLPFSEKAYDPAGEEKKNAVLGFAYKIEDPILAGELSSIIKARIVQNHKLL